MTLMKLRRMTEITAQSLGRYSDQGYGYDMVTEIRPMPVTDRQSPLRTRTDDRQTGLLPPPEVSSPQVRIDKFRADTKHRVLC